MEAVTKVQAQQRTGETKCDVLADPDHPYSPWLFIRFWVGHGNGVLAGFELPAAEYDSVRQLGRD